MKNILLIAGGGTLGENTANELLKRGCRVEIICLEDYVSTNEQLLYIKANADYEYLTKFLQNRYYDGIVNFIHYFDTDEYKRIHMLLCQKTSHLVFLSSYRVYADSHTPITENTPQLIDVVKDEDFLKHEDYAIPKSKNENFIINESGTNNWTIVRPVISFSKRRLDIVTVTGREVLKRAEHGEKILLPEEAINLVSGLDWAGNSGKLIANVLLCDSTKGEAYTVSSAQNLTWGEVANIYTSLIGAEFKWVSTEEYSVHQHGTSELPWILKYDRLFNREIDNSKILKATGLKKEDFVSIQDGIKIELEAIEKEHGNIFADMLDK